ncbi:MAG: TraB/GumN family protein [Hadesarchaea archaeon]|nr:TraB/GumN family protein [Hadesarchaea archaeon]
MIKRVGERLTIVGVAHVLPRSQREVEDTILKERPEIVGVELCPTRFLLLTGGRKGAERTLRGGIQTSALNWLLYLVQKRVALKTGMPAGEEMLTAVRSARRVGSRLELIDRDIRLTLQRLTERMGIREKIKLGLELLLGLLPFGTPVDIERVTDEEVVRLLLSSLKKISPTSYEVLIRERDDYMARRIEGLLTESSGRIICVVGAGHVPGIYRRLSRRTGEGLPRPWSTTSFSWRYA